ncbi:MAG: permease-like cell division protein FtsX [Clostridia bacterium]|nr:permease-like cell division protein FtsX [Clostridia bacterium]
MFRAIRRAFTEGVSGMAKNGLMTVTSLLVVTACIFVFGVFLMCIFNINHMTSKMANDYQVDVYVSRDVTVADDSVSVFVARDFSFDDAAYQEKLNSVETLIMGVPNVDVSSIAYTSAKTKLEGFLSALSEEEKADYEVPSDGVIADSFSLRLEDYDSKVETLRLLGELKGVQEVLDGKETYAYLSSLGGLSSQVSTARYDEIKAQIKTEIMKLGNVDSQDIGFVDGKEKFASFKEGLSAQELKDFEGLPDDLIPDAYTVKLKDLSIADETIAELEALPYVESVENSRELIAVIDNLKDIVQKISIWIIVAFALVSLFIISNTIKLTVHNRRKEINIMKYVGATDSYIRGPFIMEGIMLGILSALFAFFVSQWTYEGLMSAISSSASAISANIGLMKFADLWGSLLGAYLVLGGVIGAFGSSISVRRYLHV